MFDLSDNRNKRRKTILGYAHFDPGMGVVLAAMDFEWTCRRAIVALSGTPTVTLYERFFHRYTSLKKLQDAWKDEVLPQLKTKCSLEDVTCQNVMTWDQVTDAMKCRNVVVHGTESRVFAQECRWAVCVLEDACDNVATFVEAQCGGKGIFRRISRSRSEALRGQLSDEGKQLKDWHLRIKKQISRYDECHWIRTGKMGAKILQPKGKKRQKDCLV